VSAESSTNLSTRGEVKLEPETQLVLLVIDPNESK